jgi:acetamidase/formamidase
MPSPQTVHVGYFNAALKPVLTIDSGDIVTIESVGGPDPIDVDASGVVPPSAVPEYARIIRREVTDRGPGSHILTGPVFINGAMLGDVLEVRILEIDFAVPYGFNTQRPYTGALPEEFPGFFQRIIPIDREAKTAAVAPGVVVPVPRPFFGVMGVAPLPAMGRISSGRRASKPAISTTRTSAPARRSTCRSTRRARCSRSATPTPLRARARSTLPLSRPACAASSSSSCART